MSIVNRVSLFNFNWMMLEKVFQALATISITILLARHLSGEQFGKLYFSLALVSLFSILSSLGLDKVLVKKLLEEKESEAELIGTTLFIRVFGAATTMLFSIVTAYSLRPLDTEIIFLCGLIASSYLAGSFEIIRYYFEAKQIMQYAAIASLITSIFGLLVRFLMVIYEQELIFFAVAFLLESSLRSALFLSAFRRVTSAFLVPKLSYQHALDMLKEAFPLILSGAAFIAFTRIDQIMIGSLLGDVEVGIYSVAVRISEGWVIIPSVFATVFFPYLVNEKKRRSKKYKIEVLKSVFITIAVTYLFCIFILFASDKIIHCLFGSLFSEAAKVLRIYTVVILFNSLSMISFRYFLIEGLQIYSLYRTIAGILINVALNFQFIPMYGVEGAAIATAISQVFAAFLLNSVSSRTREMFVIQFKCLILLPVIRLNWRS